jgi:selenide,water dikinase
VDYASVPHLDGIAHYLEQGCIPGGTLRNFESYGHRVAPLAQERQHLLCDPQTSGGLLVAVEPAGIDAFLAAAAEEGLDLRPIGRLDAPGPHAVVVQ